MLTVETNEFFKTCILVHAGENFFIYVKTKANVPDS